MLNPSPRNAKPTQTVFVGEYTDGLLDPNRPMLGPVAAGGTIVANTTPGCWGPMITPAIRGGHEVTRPVYVDGAEVGDAIVIRIKAISVSFVSDRVGKRSDGRRPIQWRSLLRAQMFPLRNGEAGDTGRRNRSELHPLRQMRSRGHALRVH